MAKDAQILRADFVVPVSSPVIVDGAIRIANNVVTHVGGFDQVSKHNPKDAITELGKSAILPGLVNAHTHLELTNIARPQPPLDFVAWIAALSKQTRPRDSDYPARVRAATLTGIDHCVKYGVTTVGDISAAFDITRPVLTSSPLRVVSFGEALGLGAMRHRFAQSLERASAKSFESSRFVTAISPHAPYTVDEAGYKDALATGLPLSTHLAETLEENVFLRDYTGKFRELWERISTWSAPPPPTGLSPIGFAMHVGLLNAPTLLAHVNYVSDQELDLLANSKASVVWCPRTHEYFQHPPHRWLEMLEKGINVCVGTDSAASSGDLNLLADARLAYSSARDVDPKIVLQMITTNAARALRVAAGTIEPGRDADLAVFAVQTEDPIREILESTILPVRTLLQGV